jgi:Serine phosphatase RsbU, regulator of sigma subunit
MPIEKKNLEDSSVLKTRRSSDILTSFMRIHPVRPSLSRIFIAYILAAYVIIAIGTYFAFSAGAARVSESYASRAALSQGELVRSRILSLVDRDLTLARKLADDPAIRAWVENDGDAAREKAAMGQLESYRKFLRDGTWFVAIGRSGAYWARNPSSPGPERTRLSPDAASDRWFYAALDNGRDYSLNVDHNDMLGENRVWVNVKVIGADGRAIGIAGCGIDLTSFLNSLVDGDEAGMTTVVVDGRGALVAYRDRSIIAHNAEVKREADKVDVYSFLPAKGERDSLRAAIADGGSGARKVLSLRMGAPNRGDGGPAWSAVSRQLCAVAPLPELGWYGLVFVQADRVLGLRDLLPMIIVTLASLAVVLALVILGMRVLVVAPVRKLESAAGEIAAGAYDIVLPESSRTEVGRLASSFNAMARTVKAYTAGLEDEVAARTAELVEANAELESSQARVMESIRYARLIQDSIHPSAPELDAALDGHFEILRERDIVGGDFFFFRSTVDGFYAAVADCTGHGVPGAFMAMMAKAHLDRVVESTPSGDTAEMLAELDRLVLVSLRGEQGVTHLQNGLDIALCHYRAADASLEFAGAGLPLFVWGSRGLEELPGDRCHVGFSSGRREKSWTTRRVSLSPGARVFLATDGVLDLPGGERGLPLGRARLRSILGDIARLPLSLAGEAASEALEAYRGDRAQRDDLCLVGLGLAASNSKED